MLHILFWNCVLSFFFLIEKDVDYVGNEVSYKKKTTVYAHQQQPYQQQLCGIYVVKVYIGPKTGTGAEAFFG